MRQRYETPTRTTPSRVTADCAMAAASYKTLADKPIHNNPRASCLPCNLHLRLSAYTSKMLKAPQLNTRRVFSSAAPAAAAVPVSRAARRAAVRAAATGVAADDQLTYKKAGVDIDAGDELVSLIFSVPLIVRSGAPSNSHMGFTSSVFTCCARAQPPPSSSS